VAYPNLFYLKAPFLSPICWKALLENSFLWLSWKLDVAQLSHNYPRIEDVKGYNFTNIYVFEKLTVIELFTTTWKTSAAILWLCIGSIDSIFSNNVSTWQGEHCVYWQLLCSCENKKSGIPKSVLPKSSFSKSHTQENAIGKPFCAIILKTRRPPA